MTHADIAGQFEHMALLKHVPHQPITLFDVQPIATPGDDTRGILPAMLQYGQRIINGLIDRALADDTYDAAHYLYCFLLNPDPEAADQSKYRARLPRSAAFQRLLAPSL